MKVIVTGANGRTAAFAEAELKKQGHTCLHLMDYVSCVEPTLANLKNWSGLLESSCKDQPDSILHLAAIPRPTDAPEDEVYANNVAATYNVLEFAVKMKVKKIVCASTEAVLGMAYSRDIKKIHYLPVDEVHPVSPTDPYSLSKLTCERLCDAYVVKFPWMSISTLRFAWVLCPDTYQSKLIKAQNDTDYGLSKMFSYSDIRDVAKACSLALGKNHFGHEIFFIAANDTFSPIETEVLITTHFPHLRNCFNAKYSNSSLISNEKAKAILGYKPEFTWTLQ